MAPCFTPLISSVSGLIMAISKWVFFYLFFHFVLSKAGTGSQYTKFYRFFTAAKCRGIVFSLVSWLTSCSEAARPRAPGSTRCWRGMCELREKYFYLDFCMCYALNWHLRNVLEFNTLGGSCWMCPSRRFLQNHGSLNPTRWLWELRESVRMETTIQIIESCLIFILIAFNVAFDVNSQQSRMLCCCAAGAVATEGFLFASSSSTCGAAPPWPAAEHSSTGAAVTAGGLPLQWGAAVSRWGNREEEELKRRRESGVEVKCSLLFAGKSFKGALRGPVWGCQGWGSPEVRLLWGKRGEILAVGALLGELVARLWCAVMGGRSKGVAPDMAPGACAWCWHSLGAPLSLGRPLEALWGQRRFWRLLERWGLSASVLKRCLQLRTGEHAWYRTGKARSRCY